MPFLFVDYDHGLGGEKFCAGISLSPECETLVSTVYSNGRTKVQDIFDQEFLKPDPQIQYRDSHPYLFTVVPTHRHTDLARKVLGPVTSIRIQTVRDDEIWQRVVDQRMAKVLYTHEPDQKYFLGLLKILEKKTGSREFLKHVKKDMLTIDIYLLAYGEPLTNESRQKFVEYIRNHSREPEPETVYDLVVPYEDLVVAPDKVCEKLKNLGITVVGDWIKSYA